MSAVLQSPALPVIAAIESRFNAMEERIKSLEKENVEIKVELLETKELLAISLNRNTQIENAIFEHDAEGEIIRGEDNQPVLNAPQCHEITSEIPIVPKTTLEHKATEFALFLRDAVTTTGQSFVSPNKIMHFLKEGLSEPLRMGDIGYFCTTPRKVILRSDKNIN